ncbi:MAG: hypothetical protein JXA77_08145 [Bacteroidales bacterium]|nr:hypothetical protein [Bacteroidales bacterium]MBN2818602.1 hypothetical protein [Bacteroidales bacterium]
MKNISKFCLFISLLFGSSLIHAQSYSKVKIIKADGFTVEGKQAVLQQESVTFTEKNGSLQTCNLSDVLYIQAKKGKAKKWALGCAGGCAGFMLVSVVAASASENVTVYGDAGGVLFALGLSAGVGALIGTLTDNYETVYTNPGNRISSIINKIDLQLSGTTMAPYAMSLAYKF